MKHEDRTPEWHSWAGMLTRCTRTREQKSFKDYGGRGITVRDPRWRHGDGERTGFECFLADMGRKPSPGSHARPSTRTWQL